MMMMMISCVTVGPILYQLRTTAVDLVPGSKSGVVERDLHVPAWLLARCGSDSAATTRWRETRLPHTATAAMLPSGGGALGAMCCDRALFGGERYQNLLAWQLANARARTRRTVGASAM
jgi:hypothetical protein